MTLEKLTLFIKRSSTTKITKFLDETL